MDQPQAELILINEGKATLQDKAGSERIFLRNKVTVIGRDKTRADVYLDSPSAEAVASISRTHCAIIFNAKQKRYELIDQNSTNGTKLNDHPLTKGTNYPLQNGDFIELGTLDKGGFLLRFYSDLGSARENATRLVEERDTSDLTDTMRMALEMARQRKGKEQRVGTDTDSKAPVAPAALVESNSAPTQETAPAPEGGDFTDKLSELPTLFLSYSRADVNLKQRLLKDIQSRDLPNNLVIWADDLIPTGSHWQDQIENEIKRAQGVIVLMTPESNKSEWVKREVLFAQTHGKTIFPLLGDGNESDAVPFQLIDANWIDIREEHYDLGVQRLVLSIQQHFERLDKAEASSESPE